MEQRFTPMSSTSRSRTSQRGSAALEFALGFSLFWMLFSGVYSVGYAFYVYNGLMVSAANAATMGSKMAYDMGDPAAYTTALKNMVVYGDTAAGTRPIVPNLTTNNVNVTMATDTRGMPRDVTISISGYTINAVFANFTLPDKPRVTAQYYGLISNSDD